MKNPFKKKKEEPKKLTLAELSQLYQDTAVGVVERMKIISRYNREVVEMSAQLDGLAVEIKAAKEEHDKNSNAEKKPA